MKWRELRSTGKFRVNFTTTQRNDNGPCQSTRREMDTVTGLWKAKSNHNFGNTKKQKKSTQKGVFA